MTDATQVTPPNTTHPTSRPPDPSATPAAAPSDQSPLDILDQILKDAQAKASEAADEKLANDQKIREEERERQRQLDQQKVQEELQQIEMMKTSPEYQAMMQQKQDVVEQEQAHKKQMTGMEILQLERSKL